MLAIVVEYFGNVESIASKCGRELTSQKNLFGGGVRK